MNRVIYGLQRIKSQKTRLQLESDDDSSPFQCDLQPIIIPHSKRPFVKSAACLRLRIRTLIPMDWSQWNCKIYLAVLQEEMLLTEWLCSTRQYMSPAHFITTSDYTMYAATRFSGWNYLDCTSGRAHGQSCLVSTHTQAMLHCNDSLYL